MGGCHSIQWAWEEDWRTLDYTDENGRNVQVRLSAALRIPF